MKEKNYRVELTWYFPPRSLEYLAEEVLFSAKNHKDAKRLVTVYMIRRGYRSGRLYIDNTVLLDSGKLNFNKCLVSWKDDDYVWYRNTTRGNSEKGLVRRVSRGIPFFSKRRR